MATEILRPNAAGDETALDQYPTSGSHYDKVDEVTPDNDSTYVYNSAKGAAWYRDLYNLPAHSGSGTINKITIKIVARNSLWAGVEIFCKTHGTGYSDGDSWYNHYSYTEKTWELTTNPNTSAAWTWDEIDALQIGVQMWCGDGQWGRCTQVYVEVDYTSGETPKISSDAGSGAEGTPMPSAILAGSESGSGIEAFIARLLAAAESGYGAEASEIGGGGLLKHLFASELGEGADGLTAKIEIPNKGGGMRLWT
jgi:hypothetical protein